MTYCIEKIPHQFAQVSTDIRKLFEEVCEILNLNWTFWGVIHTIARRKDVKYLDVVLETVSFFSVLTFVVIILYY